MEIKRVYGIENENINVGFWYNADGTPSGLAQKLGTTNKDMPMPYDKEKYTSPTGEPYICSAPTLEALLHWFSRADFEVLINHGFKLHMYEVINPVEDGPQTLFRRSSVLSDTILSDEAMFGVKQVIVVRKDLIKGELAVRRGKMMAQACHASLGSFLKWQTKEDITTSPGGCYEAGQRYQRIHYEYTLGSPFDLWLNGLFTKVVVYVDGEKELRELYKKAQSDEIFPVPIPASLIIDSGLTEFHGQKTVTCLGLGPWFSRELDKLTGNLPLL